MNKRTPGPWGIKPMYDDTLGVFAGAGAECGDWGGGRGTSMTYVTTGVRKNEDARLIAAAPELLEALEAVEPYLFGVSETLHKQARAAIAKAKGEVA